MHVLLAGLACSGAWWAAPTMTYHGLPSPPPTIALTQNSHATATAWVAKYLGAARDGEADATLTAVASVYIQGCASCPGSSGVHWDVHDGLTQLCADRRKPQEFVERFRCGAPAWQTIGLTELAEAVSAGRPAIATLCYEPAQAASPVAAQRSTSCFSVAVIGVLTVGGKDYLVARDGLPEGGKCEADQDRVKPSDLGLPANEGRWCEPGTGVYRWDGANTNLVVVVQAEPATP
jgi:hypothetical protein